MDVFLNKEKISFYLKCQTHHEVNFGTLEIIQRSLEVKCNLLFRTQCSTMDKLLNKEKVSLYINLKCQTHPKVNFRTFEVNLRSKCNSLELKVVQWISCRTKKKVSLYINLKCQTYSNVNFGTLQIIQRLQLVFFFSFFLALMTPKCHGLGVKVGTEISKIERS